MESSESSECLICLRNICEIIETNPFNFIMTCSSVGCKYTSCETCMTEWYTKHNTCPYCRLENTFDIKTLDIKTLDNNTSEADRQRFQQLREDYYRKRAKESEEYIIGLLTIMNDHPLIRYNINDTEIHITLFSESFITIYPATVLNLIRNNLAYHYQTRCILENRMKTYKIGTIIKNPIDLYKIFNHSTGKWVIGHGPIGHKILKDYSIKNNVILEKQSEEYTTILNAVSGRWISKNGPTAKKLMIGKNIEIF